MPHDRGIEPLATLGSVSAPSSTVRSLGHDPPPPSIDTGLHQALEAGVWYVASARRDLKRDSGTARHPSADRRMDRSIVVPLRELLQLRRSTGRFSR